jgi:hypothetical protein
MVRAQQVRVGASDRGAVAARVLPPAMVDDRQRPCSNAPHSGGTGRRSRCRFRLVTAGPVGPSQASRRGYIDIGEPRSGSRTRQELATGSSRTNYHSPHVNDICRVVRRRRRTPCLNRRDSATRPPTRLVLHRNVRDIWDSRHVTEPSDSRCPRPAAIGYVTQESVAAF